MTIYVDCTLTYERKITTGIQRVVKKIIEYKSDDPHIIIVPIRFDGRGFLKVHPEQLKPTVATNFIKIIRDLLVGTPLFFIGKKTFRSYLEYKSRLIAYINSLKHLQIQKEDVILVADLVQSEKYVKKLTELRSQGYNVYQIVFDILPLTHPQFFFDNDVVNFNAVAKSWKAYAKRVFAISKKVASEVRTKLNISDVDYFYLGSDFKLLGDKKRINNLVFKDKSYFLVVGTIEPRKNHIQVLKTFFKIWEDGYSDKLVFIGRLGWKYDEILTFIRLAKSQYSDRFVWIQNASDGELENYYKNAKGVVCASFDEGFGLPVVEALSYSVNVICSDIEVFREIGGDLCNYFQLESEDKEKDSLYNTILHSSKKSGVDNYRPLSWNKAISALLNKITSDASLTAQVFQHKIDSRSQKQI